MSEPMIVTTEIAKFFAEQCAGTHEGQMAHVPNNPVLRGLLSAYGATSGAAVDYPKFCDFLRAVADQLEQGKKVKF